jgi:hypothetical protein
MTPPAATAERSADSVHDDGEPSPTTAVGRETSTAPPAANDDGAGDGEAAGLLVGEGAEGDAGDAAAGEPAVAAVDDVGTGAAAAGAPSEPPQATSFVMTASAARHRAARTRAATGIVVSFFKGSPTRRICRDGRGSSRRLACSPHGEQRR